MSSTEFTVYCNNDRVFRLRYFSVPYDYYARFDNQCVEKYSGDNIFDELVFSIVNGREYRLTPGVVINIIFTQIV